jgi:hypothetical protein
MAYEKRLRVQGDHRAREANRVVGAPVDWGEVSRRRAKTHILPGPFLPHQVFFFFFTFVHAHSSKTYNATFFLALISPLLQKRLLLLLLEPQSVLYIFLLRWKSMTEVYFHFHLDDVTSLIGIVEICMLELSMCAMCL